ncbi:MAG TPA: DNA-binding response regulator [Flavobacteriaceae bacterium]|nr:DNA-binding response regulator [Flavobacteriaceae bacterium]HAT63616.1 DNA-binding response regulator [Flavobacteriaceae bacterium]|tara:strand:- start:453 stop:1121 length:669 start_codon:yes stop_codon:yes gene_type:complete
MKIKVVLADDEELFRVGMSHILSKDDELEIIFQASNGKELIEFLTTAKELPDIIIMDIKMPELNGVEATKSIHQEFPEISIIALTTYNTKPFIRNMIDVGASAYLVKNSPTQKVLHTIKQVFYNGFYYDSFVMEAVKSLKNSEKSDSRTFFDVDFITQREREVLELICLQKTSQEIAEKLFISKRTVEVHRKNLLEKTGVKNLAGLVVFAIKNNLVSLSIIE